MKTGKMWVVRIVALFYYVSLARSAPVQSPKDNHMIEREKALHYEASLGIGGDLHLTPKEQYLDDELRKQKHSISEDSRFEKTPFLPNVHFFEAKPLIDNSTVFKIIKQMPKGAVLHIHDSAMVSLDWVVKNITYRDHLYMCIPSNSTERILFKFADKKPTDLASCRWELVSDQRNASSDVSEFDEWLTREMSMLRDDLANTNPSVDELWEKMMACFNVMDGLVFHAPVFRDYFRQALTEFFEDNVQYVELRMLLKETYNLDGSTNDARWLLETYNNVTKEFVRDNPMASGAKIIVSDLRFFNGSVINKTIAEVIKFRELFPDLIVGFDLVGQEDIGQPLLTYLDELLSADKNLPYIFHAGETDWQGLPVDENLIDAILLGTKRIGHGYALSKHPWALEQVRAKKIAFEVNPLSNQILGLVKDLRNHPATSLFAQGYPAVISCDDPPMWGAKGLSYDFFQAYMGMTGARTGLAFLKKMAMNSLEYSSMSSKEKEAAMGIWHQQWDTFIDRIVGNITINVTEPVVPVTHPVTHKPTGDTSTAALHHLLIFGTIVLSLFM